MGRITSSGKRENGKRGGFRLGGCTTKSAVSAAAVAPASAIATASSGHLQEARHQTSGGCRLRRRLRGPATCSLRQDAAGGAPERPEKETRRGAPVRSIALSFNVQFPLGPGCYDTRISPGFLPGFARQIVATTDLRHLSGPPTSGLSVRVTSSGPTSSAMISELARGAIALQQWARSTSSVVSRTKQD